MKGLIIIGYPGIGKSTIALKHDRYVDLDSGFTSKTDRFWQLYYCVFAASIAIQGKVVFVSSHKSNCEYLRALYADRDTDIKLAIVCPSIDLEQEWIEKLKSRYELSKEDADKRAYEFVSHNFQTSIEGLHSYKNIPVYEITSMDYKLDDYVNEAIKDLCGDSEKGE